MPQFLVRPEDVKDRTALLVEEEAHHAVKVMRLREKDEIRLFDGAGRGYTGSVSSITGKTVRIEIASFLMEKRPDYFVTVAPSVLPHESMDWLIEKATELGVSEILPVLTERTVARPGREKILAKKIHWEKVALSAAKQCGGLTLPRIQEALPLGSIGDRIPEYDLAIFGDPDTEARDPEPWIQKKRPIQMILFAGPEGGFSTGESQGLREKGARGLNLGRSLLRSETAVLCMISICKYVLFKVRT